jgi:hypothetical protein
VPTHIRYVVVREPNGAARAFVRSKNTDSQPYKYITPLPTAPSMSTRTSQQSRLALIDAEILRCKGEMERKALVSAGEGGILRLRQQGMQNITAWENRLNAAEENHDVSVEKAHWRDRLKSVLQEVGNLEPVPGTETVFRMVQDRMKTSIELMGKMDFKRKDTWSKLHTRLSKTHDLFQGISVGAGMLSAVSTPSLAISEVFKALYLGFELEKGKAWTSIIDVGEMDQKINALMTRLGENLEKVDSKMYVDLLGEQGPSKMLRIAKILKGG